MKVRKFEIVECPKCGYQYLPAEIFVPKYYFGVPTQIERDEDGKIISYEGSLSIYLKNTSVTNVILNFVLFLSYS